MKKKLGKLINISYAERDVTSRFRKGKTLCFNVKRFTDYSSFSAIVCVLLDCQHYAASNHGITVPSAPRAPTISSR